MIASGRTAFPNVFYGFRLLCFLEYAVLAVPRAFAGLTHRRRNYDRFQPRTRSPCPTWFQRLHRHSNLFRHRAATLALSGGSNRATALVLNASPYRAIFVLIATKFKIISGRELF